MATEVGEVAALLDYAGADLVTAGVADVPLSRAQLWDEVRSKFGVDAVYFKGNIPVVYFKRLGDEAPVTLARLHKQLWNYNRAPLLVAILPEEIRVLNCFAPPPMDQDPNAVLLAAIRLAGDAAERRRRLEPYSRLRLESSLLELDKRDPFARSQRVDRYLLRNLEQVRVKLQSSGLSPHTVNSLIGRSIFSRYLEDRGVLSASYLEKFGARQYVDVLAGSKDSTYELFDELAAKFNGDLFPVDAEELGQVEGGHLSALSAFLSSTDMLSGQSYFWAYDFGAIPIQLISSIYEEFLEHLRKETGAYYTPTDIVSFVLDEVLPWHGDTEEPRILDPACGSGAFLVEAYRRLVYKWHHANPAKRAPVDVLRGLLQRCIYGVDINSEAVMVTAFSCYLAMLDFIEPKTIWQAVRFPKLIGQNLFIRDFFEIEPRDTGGSFDILVGNPPWQSKLGTAASYIHRSKVPVGDQQLAQAFLWHGTEFMTPEGKLCLLMPSKGLLFNGSGPNLNFRRELFKRLRVQAIVDFSTFRKELFENATGPMAALFCGLRQEVEESPTGEVVYCTPHPSPLSDALSGVVISGDEIHRFAVEEAVRTPFIWKAALWGTSRDFGLIKHLRGYFPSLQQYARARKWIVGEGFQVGGGDKHDVPQMAEMTFVPPRGLSPFKVMSPRDARVATTIFHRPRDLRIYQAPHLLIRRGVLNGRFLASAFLDYPAAFNHSIIGLSDPTGGDTEDLKLVSAFINSWLGRYYHFLTGVSWGVERDEVELQDYLSFPVALPIENHELTRAIVDLVDLASTTGLTEDLEESLNALVFAAYGLTDTERQLVTDTIQVALEQYARGKRATIFRPPSLETLEDYAAAVTSVLNGAAATEGLAFSPIVYTGRAPYRAVTFRIDDHAKQVEVRRPSVRMVPELDSSLQRFDRQVTGDIGAGFYLRPNLKIFEPDAVHVFKPAELRYWTRSVAFSDADDILAQALHSALLAAIG